VRRLFALGVLVVLTSPAHAAAPAVAIESPALLGQAPFEVTLTAIGDAERFTWDFGDGTTAEGRTVRHTYATGRYRATVTATTAAESTQASTTVTALTLILAQPRPGVF
jgi:PKD repeat protein